MTESTTFPLEDVDLADLDRFRDNLAWAQFDTLRREDPVHWNPEPAPNHGFWAVTRYDDIWAVDKDTETFTSEKFVNLEEVDDDLMDIRRSLLETDGARHHAMRALIAREFSPQNLLRNYEAFLRQLTRQTVEAALADPEFDFVERISADFPIQVLARLLDVPREDTGQLIAWGNEMVGNTDPDYTEHPLDSPESEKYKHLPFRSPTTQDVFDYGRALRDARRGGDGRDLVSMLANRIPTDGIPLSDRDFDNYFLLLVIAGNETTRHAISNSMLGLINQPDQLRALQEDPALIADGVEELLRWASPVYHFRRTATRDVELGGKQIKEGDKVVMWFASGNRDDSVFADPYRIDVRRPNVDHLTFGKGSPHLCLGNALARMEVRLMFEELLPRLSSIELTDEPTRVRSNFVNGIKRFPVRVKRRGTTITRTVIREFEADLVVRAAQPVAEDVVALTLEALGGGALPAWTPGAHIDLMLADDLVRQYSLCGRPGRDDAWRIAVLRTPDSRGGSERVHRLRAGDTIRVRGPRNHFPVAPASRYIFIAGGIGITPLLAMIYELDATGAEWELHYGGRRRASMAFLDELAGYGDRVHLIPQDELGIIDLASVLATPRPGTLVYACGPEPLLAAVEKACQPWPAGTLHLERFAARQQPATTGNSSFELVLQRSGKTLTVPPDKSVFQAVRAAGVSVLGSCLEGICGTCETRVIDGEIDHRDSVLDEEERASGETMMICVSRCRSARLTLDL